MTRRNLSRLDVLEYALSGARMELGISTGGVPDEVIEELEDDIAELERRIKRAKRAEEALDRPPQHAGQLP
jgi:hypothetical protein